MYVRRVFLIWKLYFFYLDHFDSRPEATHIATCIQRGLVAVLPSSGQSLLVFRISVRGPMLLHCHGTKVFYRNKGNICLYNSFSLNFLSPYQQIANGRELDILGLDFSPCGHFIMIYYLNSAQNKLVFMDDFEPKVVVWKNKVTSLYSVHSGNLGSLAHWAHGDLKHETLVYVNAHTKTIHWMEWIPEHPPTLIDFKVFPCLIFMKNLILDFAILKKLDTIYVLMVNCCQSYGDKHLKSAHSFTLGVIDTEQRHVTDGKSWYLKGNLHKEKSLF